MEEEAFFLFLIWEQTNNRAVERLYSENYTKCTNVIRRASMQRNLHGNETCKRMHVDFDPLGKQICYLVYAFVDTVEEGSRIANQLVPIALFENEEDAGVLKKECETGKNKSFLSKRQAAVKVDTVAILITNV